jgi:type IV pilus assembly protein PilC
LFPTRIAAARNRVRRTAAVPARMTSTRNVLKISIPFLGQRIKPKDLSIFTRQLATLVEAGMPLLRGLRILEEQVESAALKKTIAETAAFIEGGSGLSEALAAYPKAFNTLYVNMVKAGELSGALEITLRRLADFMEKAQKIKGKIKAAMFYPCSVLLVAAVILIVLMVFVVPRFQAVFEGLLEGFSMPAFSLLVFKISDVITSHILAAGIIGCGLAGAVMCAMRTQRGGRALDWFKLTMPIFGPVFRKAAISRFARTLGTLLNSGVPILQALTIVKETAGNVIIGKVISTIHESVKQGDTIALPLKASSVFPPMVAGRVDIGEQTGALPDMLMKIADGYDEEVDNAVASMTSLLEPIMMVFLAMIVGSIVIAMFLPLLDIVNRLSGGDSVQDT